jgi:hypothetical protein
MITSAYLIELGLAKYVNPDDAKADVPKLTRSEFDGFDNDKKAAALRDVRDGRVHFID